MLRLLVLGLTDEAAASRLGCTERTVRRRLGNSMAKLGVRSRLQAGFEVCRRRLVQAGAGSGHDAAAGMPPVPPESGGQPAGAR